MHHVTVMVKSRCLFSLTSFKCWNCFDQMEVINLCTPFIFHNITNTHIFPPSRPLTHTQVINLTTPVLWQCASVSKSTVWWQPAFHTHTLCTLIRQTLTQFTESVPHMHPPGKKMHPHKKYATENTSTNIHLELPVNHSRATVTTVRKVTVENWYSRNCIKMYFIWGIYILKLCVINVFIKNKNILKGLFNCI